MDSLRSMDSRRSSDSLRSLDSLRAPENAPDIVTAFQYLYRMHEFTDFQFISHDGKVHDVHRLVLAVQSPVLSRIVYGPAARDSIQIEDVDNFALQNMIRYFYNEQIILENISDIKQTKRIADQFQVAELTRICKSRLIDIPVTVDDVLIILETAKQMQNVAKEDECIELIGKNQETVLFSQQFMKMQFQRVLEIFEKLRNMDCMTEAQFLRAAIRWLGTRGVNGKKLLMEKTNFANISLDDFFGILERYPEFFNNTEIISSVTKIRSSQPINQQNIVHETEPMVLPVKKEYKEAATMTEAKADEHVKKADPSPAEKADAQDLPRKLTIDILNESDGVNVLSLEKRVKITLQDNVSTRSIQVGIDEVLKKGLLGTIADKKASYTDLDVDLSYEGIYYMIRSLKDMDQTLTPTQCIEVLKATLYFKLQALSDKFIMRISKIEDYDPVFLDGLRGLSYFEEQCNALLTKAPLRVIMHPNFINCSAQLIMSLLQQNELNVKSESQLLLVVISWLEANSNERRHFRSILLSKIAFQNISTADFKYAVMNNPEFFTTKEKEFIMAYRNAVGPELKYFRDKLPEWYNFKTRKIG